MQSRSILGFVMAILMLPLAFPAVAAEDPKAYPTRTITLIVPFPAGSATDQIARHMAVGIGEQAKVAVVVENKPGADGNIAGMAAARSAPDGYTVFVTTNSTHAANVSTFKSMPFDPKADFAPVGGLVKIPIILAVRAESPAKSVTEFVAMAKKSPKPMTFGTSSQTGRGAGEAMKVAAGLDLLNVPYKGSPQAITDLLGGEIDSIFGDPVSSAGMVKAGRVRVLAVTSAKRLPTMPNVPTLAESGLVDFELTAWVAVFVPAKTPRPIIDKLNGYINNVLNTAPTKEYLANLSSLPFPTTPDQLGAFADAETKRWAKIVEVAKIEKQ